ncbi:hypothetical protein GOBAR_DD01884 [Gossypium barbadense]|nr:hypothetical protein GOBAR_DD01884 [Gossypium barbadense]
MNLLPNHNQIVNDIIEEKSLQRRRVEEITTPFERLFDILTKSNLIHAKPPMSVMGIGMDQIYKFYQGARGHSIQFFPTFREHIQCLLDSFQLEIWKGVKTNEINTLDVKPIIIVYGKKIPIEKESTLKAIQNDVLVTRGLSGITQSGNSYKPNIVVKEPRDNREGLANPLGFGKEPTRYLKTRFFPLRRIQEGWDISPQGRMCKERRAKRLAHMAGKKVVDPPLICPPLSETFYSVGFEHQERTPVKLMINGDAVALNMIGDRVPMSRD